MKITVIAKDLNFSNKNLLESAQKKKISLKVVDFAHLDEALAYKEWGDVVIWRVSRLNPVVNRPALFEFLQLRGCIVLNLGQAEGWVGSKFYQQKKVMNAISNSPWSSLQSIPTYRFQDLDTLREVFQDISFPVIEKPEYGSEGEGVKLIRRLEDVSSDVQGKIYQPFIENDGDYRVICLGGVVLGQIKRIAKDGEYRNNLSVGGTAENVQNKDVLQILEPIALHVSSIFNLNFCGVDIIQDRSTGKYWFLEVNTAAEWEGFSRKTGIDVGNAIVDHCVQLYQRKTTPLTQLVQDYYDLNLGDLDEKTVPHASQMYFWFQEKKYFEVLKKFEKEYLGSNDQELEAIVMELLSKPEDKGLPELMIENTFSQNILPEYYPKLSQINAMLFKFLLSLKIFGRDISPILIKQLNQHELIDYYHRLYSNADHFCILSTPAITLLFLSRRFLEYNGHKDIPELNPNYLFELAKEEFRNNESLKGKFNLELIVYTHLIIGASSFYSEKIVEHRDQYIEMIKICDSLVAEHYVEISLDNKLEFLVCARLLGYETNLFKVIYSECEHSLSDLGNYLIDRHNLFANKTLKQSFIDSEHRNVLFLMAFKPRES